MDGCNKCCEINTMSLTYGSLQVFPWKNDTIIEKMDGRKWCRHITDFFQYMYAWNQGGIIISVYDISLLQFLFWSIKYGLIRTREITDIRLLDELYARISKFSIRVYVNTSKQCFPFSLTIWNLQPLTNTLRFFYLSLKFLKIKICQ